MTATKRPTLLAAGNQSSATGHLNLACVAHVTTVQMLLKPCVATDCRQLSDRAHCPQHRPKDTRDARKRGYDTAWTKLSKRARAKQQFCSDCGATNDLQADHSAQAWQAHALGLPITLALIDVVCGTCNRARGAAR